MISKPLYAGEKSSIICKIPNVYPADRLVIQLQKEGELPSRKEFYDDPSDKTTETKWMWYHFTPTIEDTGKEITCMAELPIAEMEFEPKKRQTSEKLIVTCKYIYTRCFKSSFFYKRVCGLGVQKSLSIKNQHGFIILFCEG